MKKRLVFAIFIIAVLILGTGGLSHPINAQDDVLPARADLSEGWNQLSPGGDTICSRGTEYSFFVRPADTEKLMIYFQGGGACWDSGTCEPGGTMSQDAVTEDEVASFAIQGLFDFDNPDNPVADYNVIYVAYCTGDVHTGNNTVVYEDGDEEVTIYHQGFTNTSAVLDWVFANYEAPSDVFVSGCSAGAYGSIFAAPYIMEQYQDVPVVQIGDAGIGVATADWMGGETWGSLDSVPEWLTALEEVEFKDITHNLYVETAKAYANNTLAEITTVDDSVQTGFYFLMGGFGWSDGMEASLTELNENSSNFRSYVAGGSDHCVLPLDRFYTYEVEGVRLSDWVTGLINGEAVDNVHCEDCSEATYIEGFVPPTDE